MADTRRSNVRTDDDDRAMIPVRLSKPEWIKLAIGVIVLVVGWYVANEIANRDRDHGIADNRAQIEATRKEVDETNRRLEVFMAEERGYRQSLSDKLSGMERSLGRIEGALTPER